MICKNSLNHIWWYLLFLVYLNTELHLLHLRKVTMMASIVPYSINIDFSYWFALILLLGSLHLCNFLIIRITFTSHFSFEKVYQMNRHIIYKSGGISGCLQFSCFSDSCNYHLEIARIISTWVGSLVKNESKGICPLFFFILFCNSTMDFDQIYRRLPRLNNS